ncbi:hypothetical protein, partial [Burkholderia pseudomallei]|uniref:hypothetical protein n=1 Tax=Burkholderia pseudomallei TaxID=28450 RepID=UPI0021F6E653
PHTPTERLHVGQTVVQDDDRSRFPVCVVRVVWPCGPLPRQPVLLTLTWLNKKAAFNFRFFVPEVRRIP